MSPISPRFGMTQPSLPQESERLLAKRILDTTASAATGANTPDTVAFLEKQRITAPSVLEKGLTQASKRMLKTREGAMTLVAKWQHHVDDTLKLGGVTKPFTWFAKDLTEKLTDTDYKVFYRLGNTKILRPAWGPQILQFYSGCVAFRALFAAKRALPLDTPKSPEKKHTPWQEWWRTHDTREVVDALRRDVTSLFFFLFALDPLRDHVFTQALQTLRGIQLKSPLHGEALSLQQLKEVYRLNKPQDLSQLFFHHHQATKHWQVFPKAVTQEIKTAGHQVLEHGKVKVLTQMHKASLMMEATQRLLQYSIKHPEASFQEAFQALQLPPKLSEDVQALATTLGLKAHDTLTVEARTQFATQAKHHIEQTSLQKAWQTIEAMDVYRTTYGLEKKLPKASDFLARYAVASSVPAHILALAITSVGLGFGPVWVNKLLADKDYQSFKNKVLHQPNAPNTSPSVVS
ncbi:MAG: hypothetical protein ACKO37_09260 [Vampirovibrionales bacterium]